jgi:hypothetical protein
MWPSAGAVGRHHAARARHVLDHERLAHGLGESFREQPPEHVGIAARASRRDQPHRAGGVGLVLGRRRRQREHRADGENDRCLAHAASPWCIVAATLGDARGLVRSIVFGWEPVPNGRKAHQRAGDCQML